MPTYPIRARLPAGYAMQIGRVITRWSLLELTLRQTAYALIQVDPKIGRLMVRDQRASDWVETLGDAMSVRGLTTTIDLKELRAGLQTLGTYRDKLGHGIWLKHTATAEPVLQETRGNYQDPRNGKMKARINPRGITAGIETMRAWVTGIENATKLLRKLGREIDAQLRTSPCRCCGQPLPATNRKRRSREQ